ncbi:hypothetical protein CDAR_291031 [Caerostris darwini]|uniref:Uncharacterized protein n=1 Tax=Caerostris darwini TaxID=1538125 RepID=A0AAV4M5G7_9ARAC|nr:hypothetical protein CDAR_291031 [Caerostris darwini]
MVPRQRTFTPRTVDAQNSFVSALKNKVIAHSLPAPIEPATISQEDHGFLIKTLYALEKFANNFNFLGGVEKIYNRLLIRNNPIKSCRFPLDFLSNKIFLSTHPAMITYLLPNVGRVFHSRFFR